MAMAKGPLVYRAGRSLATYPPFALSFTFITSSFPASLFPIFIPPELPALFKGVDHILHGGDIGRAAIILELEQIAPVTAVLGNTDDPGLHFNQTEVITLADLKFLVHHIVNPHALTESIQARIARERPFVLPDSVATGVTGVGHHGTRAAAE